MSIRARLLLLILIATLVPAMLAGMRFLERRELQIADAKRDLAVETREIAESLADTIRSTAQLHYGLSRARDFDTPDRAACSGFLARVLKAHPQYTGILTIKPDGQLFCDSLRTGRTLDLKDRKYFRDALRPDKPLAVQAVFGRLTGIAVMQIAYGAHDDNGKTKFVLLASLNLENYMRTRVQSLPEGNAVVTLIDGEGTILTWHPGAAQKAGASIAGSPLFRFATESGDAGVREDVDFDGQSRIWSASRLPAFEDTGVRILIGASKTDLLASANKKLLASFVILVVIWLFVFAGAWALAERAIRRPTARLIETVNRFSSGDFSARIGAPYPRGEIGALMAAIDRAFETIKCQHEEIEKLNTDLEQRVIERTAELNLVNKELEAFSYTVSHDLRAPVRHVGGFARLALERLGALDVETRRHLEKISHAAERMGTMIDDLLALSRAGRRELKTTRVDLAAMIGKVREECMRDAADRNIVWKIGALPAVEGDAGLLHQVFVNLIDNAVKYSAGVADAAIDINAEPSGADFVQISVRDNGVGFDMAYAKKLFGVFQRLHADERFTGTGIGLATVKRIVKRIVERHGGRVWADAAPGKGAVFYVTLRRA